MRETLLMFEDDPGYARLYGDAFLRGGFVVRHHFFPPQNVVDLVLAERPAIVSMDVMMPEMDGFQATACLKGDERTSAIPIVFLTNMNVSEFRERGLSLGAVAYLIKGELPPHEVAATFRRVVDEKKPHAAG